MNLAQLYAQTLMQIRGMVAVYLKGSLLRNELREKSDIDLVCILKSSASLAKAYAISDGLAHVSAYTLRELRIGITTRDINTPPAMVNFQLHHFKLLAGKPIDVSGFPVINVRKAFQSQKRRVLETITACFEKRAGFVDIRKQTLWLAYYELLHSQGQDIYHWGEIVRCFPKDHLYQQVYRYHKRPLKIKRGKRVRDFADTIREYIANLD